MNSVCGIVLLSSTYLWISAFVKCHISLNIRLYSLPDIKFEKVDIFTSLSVVLWAVCRLTNVRIVFIV